MIRSGDAKTISSAIGSFLVQALLWVFKSLSVIGTLELLLVSDGIFVHNVAFFHDLFNVLPSMFQEFVVGLLVGIIGLILVKIFKKLFFKK